MGRPKALLDWHGRPAVVHAVETVQEGIDRGPIAVVRAPDQELPPLAGLLVDDPIAYAGPLAGLRVGLAALDGEVEVAFACGVDTPLLVPAFVRAVVATLGDDDEAVVPVIDGRAQPLLAAYRVSIVPTLGALLDRGAHGLRDIPAVCAVRELTEQELRGDPELAAADPHLRSAANANTADDWAALLAESVTPG